MKNTTRPIGVALAAILTVIVVAGCEGPTSPADLVAPGGLAGDYLPHDRTLEVRLRQAVESHSKGQGFSYFMLPEFSDLENIPQDPLNPLNPVKFTLGMYLFVDPALAVTNVRPEGANTYSCGSCHPNQSGFYSSLPQALGEGGSGFGTHGETRTMLPQYDSSPDTPDVQAVRAPSMLNAAYLKVAMWDGRLGATGPNIGTEGAWTSTNGSDANTMGLAGPETQAFAGLAAHRMNDIDNTSIPINGQYIVFFLGAFPGEPSPINRLNTAKAIAAFERSVLADQAPFQKWLRGQKDAMTFEEKQGALLFFGKAGCVSCHTGPALNSNNFHALGMFDLDFSVDPGRVDLAPFGGTVPDNVRRGRGGFTGKAADDYKFKTPQLYNLKDSKFYGHGASFASIREVVEYKSLGNPQNTSVPLSQFPSKFVPLGLTGQEIDWLTAFLTDALYDPNLMRYFATFVPSGLCFPSNDTQSQIDLGCSQSLKIEDVLTRGLRPPKVGIRLDRQ